MKHQPTQVLLVEDESSYIELLEVVLKDCHGGIIGGFQYIAKPLDVKGVLAVIERQL